MAGRVRWTEVTPPEWRDRTARAVEEMRMTGTAQPWEKEYFRKDGSRVPVLIGSAAFDEKRDQGVAILVISEELDELFTISDRLAVIAEGRLSPSVKPAETSIEQIGTWMSGKFGDKATEGAVSANSHLEIADAQA